MFSWLPVERGWVVSAVSKGGGGGVIHIGSRIHLAVINTQSTESLSTIFS